MKISQILDKVDENQLFVPAFQREYVWRKNDAKNLIASLISTYPTGTMLTWETNRPPELKGDWKYDSRQGSVKVILDGQQRITTLYMLIRGEIPPYYQAHEIRHDPRNLYVNTETSELQYYKKTQMVNNPLWVKLTDIFQKRIRSRDVVRALQKNDPEAVSHEREDKIDDNFRDIEAILEREFLEQSIPVKASIKDAIDIFYIVNASGVNLTDAELALAQISGYWPEARDLFKTKLAELEKNGFVFSLDFIVYVLQGVLHHSGSQMQRLHGEENLEPIKEAWDLLEGRVLDYVINILKTHAYVDHTKEINSVYALVPIIVYVFNRFKSGKRNLSEQRIARLVKWFYYSQFRQRYISQLQQKLDKDIGVMVKAEHPFDELLNLLSLERVLEIRPDEFVGASNTQNPLWALMRWYFKSRNAICFTTGLGIRQNMGKIYSLEWDHIFSYSRLKKAGWAEDRHKYALIQEITNRAVLTATANRSKSDKPASEYLTKVQTEFPGSLKLQCIPEDEELWHLENYEQFLRTRRKLLAKELNEYLNSISITIATEMKASLGELIADGESPELELKASLRWSYKEGLVNKKLETVILKTIAAFSNADGGTLLIGVGDDGEVLGLEHDYQSINGAKDEFEIHLRNLVNKSFGERFAATNLNIEFSEVDDLEVCSIEIKAGNQPLYLETKVPNGPAQDRFYVRSGNSSVELKLQEVAPYVNGRFN